MVSALASKVCLVLVDGAPMFPDGYRLAGIAGRENVTHLGVSAKYLDACAKQNIKPKTRGPCPICGVFFPRDRHYHPRGLPMFMKTGRPMFAYPP